MTRRIAPWVLAVVFMMTWLGLAALAAEQSVDLGLLTVKQRAEADSIRAQLVKGASFEKLAKSHSVGPAASRGGRVGVVSFSRLRSEYRRALNGLPPKKPSQVIPTEEGYTILMRFDRPAVPRAISSAGPVAATGGARLTTPGPRPPAGGPALLAARTEVMAALEFISAGDIKSASVHLDRAKKRNPYEDKAVFLEQVLADLKAGKVAKQAVKSMAKGLVDVTEGKPEEALNMFKMARLADPKLWQASLLEAEALAGMGRPRDAEALLKAVLQVNPNSARAHLNLGRLAMEKGQAKEAERDFSKAIELDPKLSEAYYHLSALAINAGDLKKAEKMLKATLEYNPYLEEAYSDLGLIYGKANRLDEAITVFRKALEINPRFAAAHVNLGIIYVRQRNLASAIAEFQKAVNIEPSLAEAHANLAAAYTIRKQWEEAIAHADMATKMGVKLSPQILKALAPHR